MRTRTSVLLTTAAVAAAAIAPSEAAAVKRFRGATDQERTVKLTIGDDNLLQSASINWVTRKCAQSGSRFQHMTAFRRPFDETTPDAFRDEGSFTVRDSGGIRSRVRIIFIGERLVDPATNVESWRGTVEAKVTVRRRKKIIDRCTLRPVGWEAAPFPAA